MQELLLLCCRRPADHTVARSRQIAETTERWDDVLALAAAHGVLPLFLAQHAAYQLPASEEARASFQQALLEITARNIALTGQLAAILRLLDSHGIPALNFKGPTLAAAGYGHLGRRVFSDLDILVSPTRIREARDVMVRMGFVLPDTDPSILDGVYPPAGSEYAFMPAEPHGIGVEMHVRPWKWRMALHLDTDALIARRRSVDVAGLQVPSLAPEDLVLVLAAHGFQHGWSHLRFIADMDAAAAMGPDWDVVLARARDARASRIVSTALVAAHTLLGTDAGTALTAGRRDPAAVAMAADIAERLFTAQSPRIASLRKNWVHLCSREHPIDRLGFCVRTLALEGAIRPFDRVRHAWRRPTREHARARDAAPP